MQDPAQLADLVGVRGPGPLGVLGFPPADGADAYGRLHEGPELGLG